MLSGLMLSLAWWDMMLAPLMLVAFVPLLWVESYISGHRKERKFSSWAAFRYSYLPFLLWNLTTIYWVAYSTPLAAALPFVQALLMALVFQAAHFCKRTLGRGGVWGNLFFALFFLAFEWLHLNWDINFPWLNLGNSFARFPALVQWYEYTGSAGGTLWIWLCNIAFFELLLLFLGKSKQKAENKKLIAVLSRTAAVLIIPIAISLTLWFTFTPEKTEGSDVVVVQPNLDPYSTQYDYSPRQVCDIVMRLASKETDDNTDFILCPESCLQDYAWEETIEQSMSINVLRQFENRYRKAQVISGMSSRRTLGVSSKSKAARKFPFPYEGYYESCNIAICIDRDTLNPESPIHHKSVLTPFVEKMPFKSVLGFLGDLALDMGGTVGTLGTDSEPTLLCAKDKPKVAAAICYESADGGYVASLVRQGAQMIFVMTNDGWWENTPGHRQHAAFASLRAIENRRPIARSANTGISCFVSPKGVQSERTEYWTEAVIKQTLHPQTRQTFYTLHGDYIYRISSIAVIALLLPALVVSHLRRKEEKKNIKTK